MCIVESDLIVTVSDLIVTVSNLIVTVSKKRMSSTIKNTTRQYLQVERVNGERERRFERLDTIEIDSINMVIIYSLIERFLAEHKNLILFGSAVHYLMWASRHLKHEPFSHKSYYDYLQEGYSVPVDIDFLIKDSDSIPTEVTGWEIRQLEIEPFENNSGRNNLGRNKLVQNAYPKEFNYIPVQCTRDHGNARVRVDFIQCAKIQTNADFSINCLGFDAKTMRLVPLWNPRNGIPVKKEIRDISRSPSDMTSAVEERRLVDIVMDDFFAYKGVALMKSYFEKDEKGAFIDHFIGNTRHNTICDFRRKRSIKRLCITLLKGFRVDNWEQNYPTFRLKSETAICLYCNDEIDKEELVSIPRCCTPEFIPFDTVIEAHSVFHLSCMCIRLLQKGDEFKCKECGFGQPKYTFADRVPIYILEEKTEKKTEKKTKESVSIFIDGKELELPVNLTAEQFLGMTAAYNVADTTADTVADTDTSHPTACGYDYGGDCVKCEKKYEQLELPSPLSDDSDNLPAPVEQSNSPVEPKPQLSVRSRLSPLKIPTNPNDLHIAQEAENNSGTPAPNTPNTPQPNHESDF